MGNSHQVVEVEEQADSNKEFKFMVWIYLSTVSLQSNGFASQNLLLLLQI